MRRTGNILTVVIKILVLIAVIAAGIAVYSTCSGSPLIQKIDKSIPDITVAPFIVATQTQNYYTRQAIQNTDGTVTMRGWYSWNKNKWILQENEITIPALLSPRIIKR